MLNKIIEHFGVENQKKKAIEELSELIIAITKNDRNNIIEELADSTIMINQLMLIYKIKDKEIAEIITNKMIRILKKIGD